MKRSSWRDAPGIEKIAFLTLVVGAVAAVATLLTVREFRAVLGLPVPEESHPSAPIISNSPTPQKSPQPPSSAKAIPKTSPKQERRQTTVDRNKRKALDQTGIGSDATHSASNEKQPSATTTSSVSQSEGANHPSFEGDTYRVTAESLRKVDRNEVLVLGVEGLESKTTNVRICGWYLLDENGERWDEEGDDTAGLCDGAGGGVNVRIGIKLKTKLVFKPKEPSSGKQFTIMGSRLPGSSQGGAQVVITGVISE